MEKTVVYPNAPLLEAAFEIRFRGEPAIECRRDEFFELVRDKYGTVLVPQVTLGQAPALALYHFKREDGSATIMTAINKFSYSVTKYEGFEAFKMEALRLIRIFSKKFNVKALNRTGLRYVNAIPFVREEGRVPLTNFLNLDIRLPEAFPQDFKYLDLSFTSKTDKGSIITHIGPLQGKDETEEAILLDFDYAMEKDLHIDKVEWYLDQSHCHTKEMFEKIITDKYREYMKGEAI